VGSCEKRIGREKEKDDREEGKRNWEIEEDKKRANGRWNKQGRKEDEYKRVEKEVEGKTGEKINKKSSRHWGWKRWSWGSGIVNDSEGRRKDESKIRGKIQWICLEVDGTAKYLMEFA
jgi:hypothetical protein